MSNRSLSVRTSPRTPPGPILVPWQGPTLRQFVQRAERSFGDVRQRAANGDLSSNSLREASRLTGLAGSEHPSPVTLRLLCDQWGLPPEDFDLEPE